jgi:hypothetical protein
MTLTLARNSLASSFAVRWPARRVRCAYTFKVIDPPAARPSRPAAERTSIPAASIWVAVPQAPQRAVHARCDANPPEPVGHGIRRPWLCTGPVAGEGVAVGREHPADLVGPLGAQLAVPGEKIDGRGVQGGPAALVRLGRLDDLLAAADGAGALDQQVLLGEVDVAPPDRAQLPAPRPG